MRFEVNFIWDCQDPALVEVASGVSVLDNIKVWHDKIPRWLAAIERYFQQHPLPPVTMPVETRPRDIYINLWLGPHLSDVSRRKIQAWAASLPRLHLININPEWNVTATYVAKPPFWNPANASDIWRLLIPARPKGIGEEDIVRIYMDTDNTADQGDYLLVPNAAFTYFRDIEKSIRESGIMFYGNVGAQTMTILGSNVAFAVFDIEKFKRFLGGKLNFDDYSWITYPREVFPSVISLPARIKYLFATTPCSSHTYNIYARFDHFTDYSPAKSTIFASGPLRVGELTLKLFQGISKGHVGKDVNRYFFSTGTESVKKYVTGHAGGVSVSKNANGWLAKGSKCMRGVLREKKYTTIDELAYDITDRIDFEIRHFREYNLPFALLLALHYRQLVNESNIVEFARLVFSLLVSRMWKYFNKPYPMRATKIVEFSWPKDIVPYLEKHGLPCTDLVRNISTLERNAKCIKEIENQVLPASRKYDEVPRLLSNKLPWHDDLARDILILERDAKCIREPECQLPPIPMKYNEVPLFDAVRPEGKPTNQSFAPALPMYPPKVRRRGFKNLNTIQKTAWEFIES